MFNTVFVIVPKHDFSKIFNTFVLVVFEVSFQKLQCDIIVTTKKV